MSTLVLRCPTCKTEMRGEAPNLMPVTQLDDWARANLTCQCGVPAIYGSTPLEGTLISVDGVPARQWYEGTRAPQRFMLAVVFLALLLLSIVQLARGEGLHRGYDPHQEAFYVALVLAEAADQGSHGMQAVAEVLRNRQWNPSGFVGAHRDDLEAFVRQQSPAVYQQAIRAVHRARNGSRLVRDATYFENLQCYGTPPWVEKERLERVTTIGDHTFFRESR